jgi:iron complex outermembrane receptor protein
MAGSTFRQLRTAVLSALIAWPFAAQPLLAQSGTITGKVTAVGSGAPIENARVTATGPQTATATTGADGSYRLVNLADGSYTIVVRVIGYSTKTVVDVRSGATANVEMQPRVVELNETVVTASRSRPEKALDAPASISVISSERIEERPAITVTDHLRATPGVDISRGGIAQANVVARGFNNAFSGSMLMLQDYRFAGVPSLRVNVPFLMTGTNEDIDRIEVLLGPASALYGPNSSSGVLHVITKSPFNSQGTTISVDGGERSVLRSGLRHAGKVNDKLAYKLSGEYMQGKDWQYTDLAEPRTFGTSTSIPAARRGATNQRDFDLLKYTGEARVDVRPRDGVELITTLGHTRVGSGLELTGANGTAQIKNWTYTNLQQRFRWNRFFAQAFLNMSNAGNDTSTSTDGTFLLRSGQPIVDKSRVWALQAQHGFDLGAKQTFTYGADYIKTDPRTGGTINGANEENDNVSEYGGYLQSSTKPTKQFELLLAARVDQNNVIEGTFFSPRAALIFKPTETQNVRVTYNRAFSTPANFSFFLDLISSPNIGGSGFDLIAKGNPPKKGWQFAQTCGSNSALGAFCMKSRFTGSGAFVGASAASAFPGLVQGNSAALTAGIAAALAGGGIPAAAAQQLATGAIQYLGSRSPTNTDLATRVSYLTSATTPLTAAQLTPVQPLDASYSETYELGYKGIVGNKFRYDISFWGQDRGDVATTAALATPNVFFGNPTQLGGYIGARLGESLGPALAQAGVPAANIPGIISAISTSLTTSLAPAPLGVVTFDDPRSSPTQIYATYQKLDKAIWVRGMDLAVDVVATDRLTFDGTFSYQSQNIWNDIIIGGIPFMSNTPNSRGSLGARYRNEGNGFGWELRSRYNEAYPINSGVYATNNAFAIAAGNPGAGTPASTALGYNRCNPNAAATFCYETVPEAFIFDAQISKRFDVGAQRIMWSISAQNMFDNRVRTFAGAPEIGRMIMTRLQYSF